MRSQLPFERWICSGLVPEDVVLAIIGHQYDQQTAS